MKHLEDSLEPCGQCTAEVPPSQVGAVATSATSFSTALLAIIPSFTCPACLSAYAGVLSATGLGFVLQEAILGPLVVIFLFVNLLMLRWTSRSHASRGPLFLALGSSTAVILGRFALNLPPLLYVGAGGLFIASMWNLWLKRPSARRVRPT